MNLTANASRQKAAAREGGYAMAALLVAMSVMAILLTVALPTWKQTVQREKEEELIFRGNQYVRAIGAYQRKYANASPQRIDVLIEQHFLRRKFKDPLSPAEDGEFQPLYASAQTAQGGQGAGTGTLASITPSGGGIIGVASKNTGLSIRTYNNATHYNEWQFIALQQSRQAGAGQGGTQGGQSPQGGRGTQGGQGTQGQRGQGRQSGTSQTQGRGASPPQGR